jgi:hypothetical protein
MRPHPRIRKTIKWGGAAATLLLVVVWIGSSWIWIDYDGNSFDMSVDFGRISLTVCGDSNIDDHPGWYVRGAPPKARGLFGWTFERIFPWADATRYYVPLWAPTGLMLAMAGSAWSLDTVARRRARLNLCPKCNYDRAGIAADAVCPECGRAAP